VYTLQFDSFQYKCHCIPKVVVMVLILMMMMHNWVLSICICLFIMVCSVEYVLYTS